MMVLMVLGIMAPIQVYAQGSIYGSVTNSDASVPATGEVIFFGFLNNTDSEIRTEQSFGAGFDLGNWYDDFQNYLDESPGIPYTYRFYNIANGEGAELNGSVPANSFHKEDISLEAVSWSNRPSGLAGRAVSDSRSILYWDTESDITWHVYRRYSTAVGSFFRIDDPSGSLANPGVATAYFSDLATDGNSLYDYLIVPENAGGSLGPHSEVVPVDAGEILAPEISSIEPNIGPDSGGTAVVITGIGFDPDGVSAYIGGIELTDVAVISPFELSGLTPAGDVGTADVQVVNLASGFSSNNLYNAYTYTGNVPPVLHQVGDKGAWVNEAVTFDITATDPDGDIVSLFAGNLPPGADFVDNGWDDIREKYVGAFIWTPGIEHVGAYDSVHFIASDQQNSTDEYITITVTDGNFICGDANNDTDVNLLDILYLIRYIYVDPRGPAPVPIQSGDLNGGDGEVNLLDILYLISHIYGQPPGPAPVCP